ncbi:hypothetical protein [Aeromicrobium sp.]|uniref:hypothetical protein n=1 Tax=Aeromicrobium sp. TaxID=1871063 RepID=UPI003D6AEED3
MDGPSEKDLNRLFSAALQFGKNWMRPVPDLAAERLAHRSQKERAVMATLIEKCRSGINAHIEEVHIRLAGAWDKSAARDVDAWIAGKYPWMSRRHRRHAIRQGQYYAWHDHG